MNKAYVACALALTLTACGGGTSDGSGGGGTSSSTSKSSSHSSTGSMTTTTGTMSTTTTGATMSTTTTTSTGAGMCTDYGNIPVGDCDIFQQNCTGNMTCAVFDDGMGGPITHCGITAGLKNAGDVCNDPMGSLMSECAKGLFCIGGFCSPACCHDNGNPCGSADCVETDVDATHHFFSCSYAPACTLFTSNACAAGTDCHPYDDTLAECYPPSTTPAGEGQPCMFVNDCGDMQICVGADPQSSVCRYACHFGNNNQPGMGGCPTNQTCQGLQDFTSIGVCSP
jgi:hypothetical protein